MIIKTKFEVGDRVRVAWEHMEDDEIDTSMFCGAIATIESIDNDYHSPIILKFEDEELEEMNYHMGTILWRESQLIFWNKEFNLPEQNKKYSNRLYHEPKRVTTINKNDLQYLRDSIDVNIKKLHSQQNTIEAVLYSLVTLRDSIEKRMKELE